MQSARGSHWAEGGRPYAFQLAATKRRVGSASGRRSAFTILELLVVIGIMGMLMAIILPAVGSAREAARRTQCISQLRQIGIALHSYHENNGCLPPGCQWEWTRQSAYGWTVPLLPFLEQSTTYRRLDRERSLFDPVNEVSRETPMSFLMCPSDIADPSFIFYHDDSTATPGVPLFPVSTANYVGVFGAVEPDEDPVPTTIPGDGAFVDGKSLRFVDFQRGLSNTLFTGERTMERLPSTWVGFDTRADDGLCRLVGMAGTTPNCETCDECEFSSRHHGGAMFLWGDGRVRMISEKINSAEYQALARRSIH